MAQRRLRTVLEDCLRRLEESRRLADDAYRWSLPGASGIGPRISVKRRDSMMELAFLRTFLAWESFLEESFILYLSGQKPPRGRPPVRYAFPPNHKAAIEWFVPESGRPNYARWTVAGEVTTRAERVFRAGRPFAAVLRGGQNVLDKCRTIRNAIAHESESSRTKFETLARAELVPLPLPPRLTVGTFLTTTVPASSPPVSFLDHYVDKIDILAKQIVRS